MYKRTYFVAIILCSVLVFPIKSLAKDNSVVLVNIENMISLNDSEVSRLLKRLYLKERTYWPNGERAIFFSRSSSSNAEGDFRRQILKMDNMSLDDHWLRLKQTRGETPPRTVQSTRILLRQIETKTNAVGVVSYEQYELLAASHPNVRILIVLDGDENDN